MAEVRPLYALRYNTQMVGGIPGVLCPPYDVISSQAQEELLQRSPFNVVRLELGIPEPGDDDLINVYTRAAALLQKWLDEGVLEQDPVPAYYLLAERYDHGGTIRQRLSLFAAVRLEEYGKGVVIPHEQTRPGPKEDRLRLMRACRAIFSPVMALYRDPGGLRPLLLRQMEASPPDLTLNQERIQYRLWLLRHQEVLEEIQELLAPLPLYLADGHHRYETALVYRDSRRAETHEVAPKTPAYDFALACLIDLLDPGVEILSFHRLLHGMEATTLEALRSRVAELFQVRSYDVSQVSRPELEGLLEELEAESATTPTFGMVEPQIRRFSLLSLRPDLPHGKLPEPSVPDLGRCEAWVLHQALLEPIMGAAAAGDEQVSFLHDLDEVAQAVATGRGQILFLLRPMDQDLFEALVGQGQRLPPKSTYFDPKLPTGLVMHLLDGEL